MLVASVHTVPPFGARAGVPGRDARVQRAPARSADAVRNASAERPCERGRWAILTQLVNKRRIAAIRGQPNGLADATSALAEWIDHVPLDQESWQELASLYLAQGKYAQAAYTMEELVLLAPHNSFYLLQYAETLYTADETAKAYKIYLRILELGEGNLDTKQGEASRGPWARTLWGLKLVRAAD